MTTPATPERNPEPSKASDPELVASLKLASIEQVVGDILFEDIQACGTAWRNLAQKKQDALDEDNLRAVFHQVNAQSGIDAIVNREDRRAEASVLRLMTGDVKRMILMAQHNITYQAYGDENWGEYIEQARDDFENEQRLYALGEQDGQSHEDRYMTKVYIETGESYKAAITAENDLIQKFTQWLGGHPNRFGELVEWMNSPEAGAHGENRPLFELLARFEFDPKLQFIEVVLEHWKKQPRILQGNATSQAVDRAIPQTEPSADDTQERPDLNFELTDEDTSWIKFLPTLLKQFGIDADPDLIKAALHDTSFEDLPASLRQAISNAHSSHLESLREAYLGILDEFKKPSRFLAFDVPKKQEASQAGGRKRRGSKERTGGRTTVSSRAVSQVVEIEPVAAINDIHGVTNTPHGYVITELARNPQVDIGETTQQETSAGRTLQDKLQNSTLTQKFLKRYQNDARLPQDIEHMFESILLSPRGNGCTKLKNEWITLGWGDEKNRKAYPVWHLNPNKRAGLSVGDVGRKTRIYFAVIPGEKGEELVLLDVSNKNVTDEYRAGDWHW